MQIKVYFHDNPTLSDLWNWLHSELEPPPPALIKGGGGGVGPSKNGDTRGGTKCFARKEG